MKLETSLIVAACVLLTGCAGAGNGDTQEAAADPLGPGEVATVNGQRIPESLFRQFGLATLQKTAEQMSDEERAALIEQLVTLRLVANAGTADRIHEERRVAAELELMRMQTIARRTVERYIDENPPTESELRALYNQQMANLQGTEYNARHILLESREDAEKVIDLLDAGGDFAELAREHSTGPTGPNGGQLDWFTPDRMVQPFSDAVQTLEVGTYTSEPVQTQFGWHVILLEDTRDRQPPGLESMRAELTTLAERQKTQAYVERLRNSAVVEVTD